MISELIVKFTREDLRELVADDAMQTHPDVGPIQFRDVVFTVGANNQLLGATCTLTLERPIASLENVRSCRCRRTAPA